MLTTTSPPVYVSHCNPLEGTSICSDGGQNPQSALLITYFKVYMMQIWRFIIWTRQMKQAISKVTILLVFRFCQQLKMYTWLFIWTHVSLDLLWISQEAYLLFILSLSVICVSYTKTIKLILLIFFVGWQKKGACKGKLVFSLDI